MNRTITIAVALGLLLGAGMACASIEPVGAARAQPSAEVGDATLQLKQAFSDVSNGDDKKAAPELDKVIAAPSFDQLPAQLRFQTLYVATVIAFQDKQYAKAHRLAIRATGFDQATGTAWTARLFGALYTSDNPDAGRCVEVLARRWPKQLDDIRPQGIVQTHHALRVAHEDDVDRAMLDALFDANWQADQSNYDTVWRDLALLQIQHNDSARAAMVAARRIRSASAALSMRIDKRFDPITRRHPQAFDVDQLLAAQIQVARARIKDHPDQLESVQRLQDLLIEKGRNAEVLAVSDAAVAHAEHGDGEKTYTDFGSSYNWVLNQRSLALAHDGRWDDAVREMTRAARRPENGGVNVSQSINLGGLFADLDQPDKAAAAIVEPGEMSPNGNMQLEYVRLQISIEKNDTGSIAKHMAYLQEHRTDDIATWQRALLRHGDLDTAAALLIQRLNAPDWRSGALVEMQHYAHSEHDGPALGRRDLTSRRPGHLGKGRSGRAFRRHRAGILRNETKWVRNKPQGQVHLVKARKRTQDRIKDHRVKS
jgi:beta-barrel assembly-enhancing protease